MKKEHRFLNQILGNLGLEILYYSGHPV